MILNVGKSTSSRNASATLAFHQYRQAATQDAEEADSRASIVKIVVERIEGKFRAKLHIEVAKNFSVLGPVRASRPEAINDGVELGKIFVAEGTVGARRIAVGLQNRTWTPKEIADADESQLEGFILNNTVTTGEVVKKLIPPGEGWVRHDDTTLVNPQSQVFFIQLGRGAGTYMKMNPVTNALESAGEPHVPKDFKAVIRGSTASWIRKGAKLDRTVLLNDISKIARLALKFPLSFVDQPACAYALFQGLRSSESAQWCAENFHKKLLPFIAEKIHSYDKLELQQLLQRTIEALDAEILKSAHAYSGCSAILALVLGENIVVGGVGHVRAVLLPEKGKPQRIVACAGSLADADELSRIRDVQGIVRDRFLFGRLDGLDEAARILAARHPFEVLQIEPGGPSDEKQIRSAYRKLALRVHPDKQTDDALSETYKLAFTRLESAKEAVEAMLAEDPESCREVHKVLRADVHTRAGAAAFLGVDATASSDTTLVAAEADKLCKRQIKRLEQMIQVCPDYERAVAACHEAVATLRRACTEEALPRYEALLKEGVSSSQMMGARDLRLPHPIVVMKPETSHFLMPKSHARLALLCGATSDLSDEKLVQSSLRLTRHPKASALRWCMDTDSSAMTSSAVCITLEPASSEPPAKKTKVSGGPEGAVRVRHILFRHQQLRQADPMARREGAAKNAYEAEAAALATLEKILQDPNPNAFLKLCREQSDCQSAQQPGNLTGDLGWIGRGQTEQAFEDVAFSLNPNNVGDIAVTSRGVHLIQRLA